jgi:hypothetical protein
MKTLLKGFFVDVVPIVIAIAIIFFGMGFGLKIFGEAGMFIGFIICILVSLPISCAICLKMDEIFE